MALIGAVQIDSGAIRPPWETSPYGVVSLLDMLRLFADFFVRELSELTAIESKTKTLAEMKPSQAVPGERCVEVYAKVGVFSGTCVEHRLSSSALKCGRIYQTLEQRLMVASYSELNQWFERVTRAR